MHCAKSPAVFAGIGLLLLHAANLPGQVLLFHSSAPGDTEQIHFSTPAGDRVSPTQPASFDPGVTVILDPSLLIGPRAQAWNARLLSFSPKAGTSAVDLVSLAPGQGPKEITAATRQQFLAGIKTLATAAAPDAEPISFTGLLEYLQTFPTSAVTWKRVVFAGREPPVPTAMRDYANGILARTLASRRLRLSHYRLDPVPADGWNAALLATGGDALADADSSIWVEAKVPDWAPKIGFLVAPGNVRADSSAIPARAFPWIWSAETTRLPAIAEYSDFLTRRDGLSHALAGTAPLPPDIAADLEKLLAINPSDPDTLNLATDFADRNHDYTKAALYAARIGEVEPANGPNFARLGYFAWQTGDADSAERNLLHARELHADHPQSAAILGEIHYAKKDYPAATIDYQEAARREPERVELWLKLADTQQFRGDKPAVALALEEVLKRNPETWDRRTQIVDYYLEAGDSNNALRHLQSALNLLPADPALVARFAEYSERLEQLKDAVLLWSRVIELDRANESAYYSLAVLQSKAGAWDQALKTTEAGVAAVSASARLQVLRVEALNALGRIDDARLAARTTADRIADPALFAETAAFEDRYGADSPRYYKSAVESMRAGVAPDPAWRAAAERGLMASIREQQPSDCAWFAAQIASNLCAPGTPLAASTVVIPGGSSALLFMAHGPRKSSPRLFLADLSRTLTANETGLNPKAAEAYRADLVEYFHLLADLKIMGTPGNGKTLVRLSLQGNRSEITAHALELIGWSSRRQSGKLIVEPVSKGENTKRQNFASALAIDIVAMQENLQSGKEFVLEIPEETVSILPDEAMWQNQFYPGEHFVGGFAEAMVRNLSMASFYGALSNMEPAAGKFVISSGMKYVADKYGRLLTLYSSCLEMYYGHVKVPGGDAAEPVWMAIGGVPPNDPGGLIRALLDKDDGLFFRFYFLISQLDFNRQKFFTANQKRTAALYDAFRQTIQTDAKASVSIDSAPIADLFRELPLDADGRVLFPGSAAVWLSAKNQPTPVRGTNRSTAPEFEDEILLHLMLTESSENGIRQPAWRNFLAVVRVESAHLETPGAQPLDEASAQLLAEKYSTHRGLYGYFAALTGLKAEHYREVLSFSEKIQGLDRRKTNIAVGLLQSGLYLLSAAERSGRIAPAKTAALLLDFARAMNQSPTPSQWSHASLDFLSAFIDAAGADRNNPSLGEILVPPVANQPVAVEDGHTVNPREKLLNSYARVLELQKVPPENDLLKIHGALLNLYSGTRDLHAAASILTECAGRMQDIEIPKNVRLPESDLELLKSSQISRFTELDAEFQKEAAKKNIDTKHLRETADQYWDALAFRTLVTVAGQIYAANFRPEDLLIAEDPLFLRKHQFVPWDGATHALFGSAELRLLTDSGGSRVLGGFDRISAIAGQAAIAGLRDIDANSAFVASALLGSIRAADWSHIDQKSVRAVAVQIHAAQDWLILAGTQPRIYDAIGTASYGILSLNRRARLLQAVRSHDWSSVWSSVSVTDLFLLAPRVRALLGEPAVAVSPSIQEFLASPANPPAAYEAIAPALQYLQRRSWPTMVDLPPYEQVALSLYPAFLADRVSEFKIYLVRLFAERALPAAALPAVAEVAARAVLADVQMTDLSDWRGVLDAYERFDDVRLKEAMAPQWP